MSGAVETLQAAIVAQLAAHPGLAGLTGSYDGPPPRAAFPYAVIADGLVVDIGLCLVLIPIWGITGAAVAWAASVVVRNAMTLVQVYRINRITPFSRAAAVVAVAAVACFAGPLLVVGAVGELTIATFLMAVTVGGVAYAGVLWVEREPLALSAFSSLLPAGRRRSG